MAMTTQASTQNKPHYLEAKDLEWFNLSQYDSTILRCKTLTEWCDIIGDRVFVDSLLSGGFREQFDELFPRLLCNPLQPLGLTQNSLRIPHATDTATVQSVTVARVDALYSVSQSAKLGPTMVFDEVKPSESAALASFAHIAVDLRATNSQIEADFASWLSKWRSRHESVTNRVFEEKTRVWADSKVVPYFDLELFARLSGKRIRPATYRDCLGDDSASYISARRRREKSAEVVFTNTTFQALRLAADCAERSNIRAAGA